MTLTCQHIIDRVRALLRDADPDGDFQHSDETLLDWLSEAYLELVVLKPNAHTVTAVISLQPGTEQRLPDDGIIPIRAMSNMGLDGATRGPLYTMVNPAVLYSGFPNWMQEPPELTVQHVMVKPQSRQFQVYPPQPDPAGHIEIEYTAIPAAPVDINAPLSVADHYAPVLTNYVTYRALSEDSDHVANRKKAVQFYQLFARALGVKMESDDRSRRRTE